MTEKTMVMKVHENPDGHVLAAADKVLLNKTLREGPIVFKVSELFYSGGEVDAAELGEALDEAGNINLVGNETIRVAIEKGLIGKNDGKKIEGVPHVQIYKV